MKSINNPHRVNVVAILTVKLDSGKTKSSKKKSIVKIVVGTDDPNNQIRGGGGPPTNLDPQRTNELQNRQFRKNLRELGISYQEDGVIQIFNVETVTGTPGIYRLYISALVCAKIDIISFYSGERALLFPLQTCKCHSKKTKYDDEVISAFIQVSSRQLSAAKNIFARFNLGNEKTPLDENQLCINANNI